MGYVAIKHIVLTRQEMKFEWDRLVSHSDSDVNYISIPSAERLAKAGVKSS